MRRVGLVILVAAALVVAGCGGDETGEAPSAPAPEPQWTVKGKIVSVDGASQRVTIAHEAIPGLMDAMTMAFAAESEAVLEGLSAGDAVEFELVQKPSGLTVTKLKKIEESQLGQAGTKQHTVRGTVVLVNPATYSVMVENEAVPGFLEADTRVFAVNPPSLLEGLKESDRIEFTLTERENGTLVITELRKRNQ